MADWEASAAAPPRSPPATKAAGAGAVAAAPALRRRPWAEFEVAASPPQAPPARKKAAAGALRELLPRVADAVLLGFVGAMWVNNATISVAIAANWACGEDSRAAVVAKKASHAAIVAMGVLIPVAAPRLMWKSQFGRGATRRPDEQQRRCASSGARLRQDGGHGPVFLALRVMWFCLLVMLVCQLIQGYALAKGFYQQKFGSAIRDMASLINSVVQCFFLTPRMFIQLRATLM